MREFRVDIPEAQLDDLRTRLAMTRWPEPATVEGWTQGVPLEYAQELCAYWADGYDWRRCEAELNAIPQFVTGLDGGGDDSLDIHFLHVRSSDENALPLLLTHGWPGSVVEFLDVIGPLSETFHVVAPSLPGFGFSAKPAVSGWGVERIATAWAQLMDRLGYDRWVAAGGDWGSIITTAIGMAAPDGLAGIHLTMPITAPPPMPISAPPPEGSVPPLTDVERQDLEDHAAFGRQGIGYSFLQATRPQTIGYGLLDSPSAQCTWIVEKFQDWSDCAGHPENAISRDRLLDNVMLYWLPGAGASAARLYWEGARGRRYTERVAVPTGVTQFPCEMFRMPRSWIERHYTDLRHFTRQKAGGHFASLEQPDVYVAELGEFFGTLR